MSMRLFMQFPEGKRKALTLSYDDGVEQDIRLLEILDRHGIKATFNLNSKYYEIDERTYEAGRIHRPMGKDLAVKIFSEALKNGHEVAVHGYTHPFWNELPQDVAAYDIIRDRARLEELFGGVIRGSAYPYGTHSDATVNTLRTCGICYSRTTVSTRKFSLPTEWLKLPATCHHNDEQLFALTEKFVNEEPKKNCAPWLFYLWGHSYEFESNDNWDRIERFAEMVGNKDDVWYATNIAIYDYIAAYKALRFSLSGKIVENPSAIPVWFEYNGVSMKVDAGETVTLG